MRYKQKNISRFPHEQKLRILPNKNGSHEIKKMPSRCARRHRPELSEDVRSINLMALLIMSLTSILRSACLIRCLLADSRNAIKSLERTQRGGGERKQPLSPPPRWLRSARAVRPTIII